MWARGRRGVCAAGFAAVLAVVLVVSMWPGESGATRAAGKVRIALIDSGVKLDHPAFVGYEIRETDLSSGVKISDHGTMMLSVLLGVLTAEPLEKDSVVVSSVNIGRSTAEGIATAIDSAVDDDADLISISLGVRRDNPALAAAVERARAHGTLIVAAAGNVRFLPADFPARYPDVLSVAAKTASGELRSDSAQQGFDTAAAASDIGVLRAVNGQSTASGTSVATAIVVRRIARQLISGQLENPLEVDVEHQDES